MPDVRLIDANALRKDIHTSYSDDLGILEHIDNAPTVDAQLVKHGKWIPMDEYCAKCSKCGWWQKTNGKCCTGHANIHKAVYKYCTACGAKMDGDS